KHGDEVFYEGEIAHAIVEDMRRHDGLVGAEDLRGWRTVRNAPLWGSYRGYRVSSNRPPGGGVLLLQMLNILEHFDLRGLEHNSAEVLAIVRGGMKRGTIHKDRHVGDPKVGDGPGDRLGGKAYAKELAEEIRAGRKADVPRFNAGAVSRDTTHVS